MACRRGPALRNPSLSSSERSPSSRSSTASSRRDMFWDSRYRRGGTSGPGSAGLERRWKWRLVHRYVGDPDQVLDVGCGDLGFWQDRKSTRLNSSHVAISYAVFCLKKKKTQ